MPVRPPAPGMNLTAASGGAVILELLPVQLGGYTVHPYIRNGNKVQAAGGQTIGPFLKSVTVAGVEYYVLNYAVTPQRAVQASQTQYYRDNYTAPVSTTKTITDAVAIHNGNVAAVSVLSKAAKALREQGKTVPSEFYTGLKQLASDVAKTASRLDLLGNGVSRPTGLSASGFINSISQSIRNVLGINGIGAEYDADFDVERSMPGYTSIGWRLVSSGFDWDGTQQWLQDEVKKIYQLALDQRGGNQRLAVYLKRQGITDPEVIAHVQEIATNMAANAAQQGVEQGEEQADAANKTVFDNFADIAKAGAIAAAIWFIGRPLVQEFQATRKAKRGA